MILAVIDLAERGVLTDNEIRYEDTWDGFSAYVDAVRPGVKLDPYLPFFHLRSEKFWVLDAKNGVDDQSHRPTHRSMMGRHASLAPEDVHRDMTSSSRARGKMRELLIERWFPEKRERLESVINSRQTANEYETQLREGKGRNKTNARPNDNVRKQSFRRLVLEAYDYRCAATGWRILVPSVGPLVDAAHLVPFKDSHDDRPCNGIALTPTFHRALDRHLIAPGPDMKWRVSTMLDKRILDNRPFIELEGQDVIFQGRHEYHPETDALQWRIDNLLKP